MLKRRGFLSGSTIAAGMAAAGAMAQTDPAAPLRTVVVGAGMSGLYSTYRLINAGHASSDIAIFEASDRVGGRLRSERLPGADNVAAEFGGMRFLTSQKLVTALIAHLGLKHRGFPMGGPANLVHMRGKRWTDADYARKGAVPFDLAPDEAGMDPTALMVKAINQVVPGAEKLTLAQWDRVKQTAMLDGRPLHAWGYRDLMNRFLSYEAMVVVQAGGGYNSIPTNCSASEALPWLLADFVTDPTYRTLIDGMHGLPVALAEQVESQGVKINRQHRLMALRVPAQTGTGLHELVFDTPSGPRTIRAQRVILGLPRRSLDLIEDARVLRDRTTAALLGTVTPRALAKAYIAHADPYWRRFGLTSGKATTDLPGRQFYYFGTEPERTVPANGYLTMAYFDGDSTDFWDGRRRLESHQARGFSRLDAKGPFAREMQRQIARVHDLPTPPEVLSAGYVNWGDDPYGGGWHSWNQGEKSWEIMPRIIAPVPGVDLHIIGEAWSTGQGWIEGALQTTENLLTGPLNTPRPNWL